MTSLNTNPAPRPDLTYPFERGFSPKIGQPFEVTDGVFWLRVPLPIALDHINLWLLRDTQGWVIVDSGFNDPMCRAVWEQVFADFLDPSDVNKVIVTHYHPDHIGLASWLAHRCQCKVFITQGEFERYRKIVDREGQETGDDVDAFLHETGFSAAQQKSYREFFHVDLKPANERLQLPDCEFIQAADELQIGDHQWRVVIGNGHSPEHACLYCPELEVLISGDQALPRISSNVSVYYTNRDQNPLADWLASCERLKHRIPANTLVLPSHQEPFIGIDKRMQQLIDDHTAQLNKLRTRIIQPVTAAEAHKYLFERELNEVDVLLATGETLAHINYLLATGELTKTVTTAGTAVYDLAVASSAA